MKEYSVKEVAHTLDTDPETIRRWIRDGKLKASQNSRKEGNNISEGELKRFVKSNAKYAPIAASSMAFSPVSGLAIALGGIVANVIVEKAEKEKRISESMINPAELDRLVKEEILRHQKIIKKRKASIIEIERTIKEEEKQLNALIATRKAILKRMEKEEDN